jgi:phage tail-like protein
MPNQPPRDHLVNCKFQVEIEGITVAAFTAVDGVESTTEVIRFADGNQSQNDRKRPGRTHYTNIVLKRGYVATDELWQWYKMITQGQLNRRSGSIIVLRDDGSEAVRYNFFEAWPCRWKSLVLDAANARNLVEELELVVEKVERA